MTTTTTFDVTELGPRDRHRIIFDSLAALRPAQTLTLLVDHDPVPLRYQLDAERPRRFRWEYREAGPERWIVDITSQARVFDASPNLVAGEEPFAAIMGPAATVEDDEISVVYAPFGARPARSRARRAGLPTPGRSDR